MSLAALLGATVIFNTLPSSPTSTLVFVESEKQDASHLSILPIKQSNRHEETGHFIQQFGFDPGLVQKQESVIVTKLLQDIDPKIDEINQSLKAMEKIDFPEKGTYITIAKQRIEYLEALKTSIQ